MFCSALGDTLPDFVRVGAGTQNQRRPTVFQQYNASDWLVPDISDRGGAAAGGAQHFFCEHPAQPYYSGGGRSADYGGAAGGGHTSMDCRLSFLFASRAFAGRYRDYG